MSRSSPQLRALGWLLHVIGVLFVANSLFEFVGSTYPVHVSSVDWRFGAFGVLSLNAAVPMLGLFAALVAATLLEQRTVLAIIGALSAAAAVTLLGILAMFGLDALEVWHRIVNAGKASFYVVVARSAFLLGYTSLFLGVCAALSIKSRRATPVAPKKEPESVGLVRKIPKTAAPRP